MHKTIPYLPLGRLTSFVLLLTGLLFPQEVGFLDLTRFEAQKTQPTRMWGSGGMIGVEGREFKPDFPFKITLLRLDKSRYRVGENFVYEVRLENVSERTYAIPWEPDWRKIYSSQDERPPAGFANASLYLSAVDPQSGEPKDVTQNSLYGSSLVAGSLKTLRPGERVRIRASGTWTLPPTKDEKPPIPIEVQARLHYYYGVVRLGYDEKDYSSQKVTVELRKR